MYKEILRSIDGVEIGGTISFLIFFVFFLMLLVYVMRMKKGYREEMKNLPLDLDNNNE
jgi:cbb3-type cytochrome oxidase subunit 3